ncbi:EAL domain-containing protein [Mesorhizobium microcysteis]|uniref:EAL domain-containing protein n=1 Tax=Neoaquamicrobium microcysteis TaxID=2682781 RepID=A0A5D4GPF2_9HYPH|nr:EAL domain-containing protein [Mesorhizobium microcysteis]
MGNVKLSVIGRRLARRSIFRATYIPALLALVVIAAAWLFAEHLNRRVFEQNLRADVLGKVSVIRANLEGNINSNIQLVRGLVATLATEPDMDQQRFSVLAANLLEEKSQIRNIAGARNLVVGLMYPLRGNERAMGLDYRLNEVQREAAERARDTRELTLAGPLDLVQGGQGLIGRFPVFAAPAGENDESFWGIVSAVVDVERLYADSGILDPALPLEIDISGLDGMGAKGARFYGSGAALANDPVLVDVVLPSGSWQIAAIPKGGWSATPTNVWWLRLLMFVAGALIMVPAIITGRLIEERQKNIGELKRRETQLAHLSSRLGLALDTSKVAVWETVVGSDTEYWDPRMNEMYGHPVDDGPRTLQDWEQRVHPDDRERASAEFMGIFENGSYTSQYRIVLDDGTVRHIRALGTLQAEEGQPSRIVGVNWDVTADVSLHEELKRANALTEARNAELEITKARIEYNALHDSLTGLPNRRYLDDLLAEHAARFARGEETAALLQIDLDRFKQINDTLGHAAGDAMLVHAAEILRSTVEPGDFVARIGGDEFVVVRRWAADDAHASVRSLAKLAERIIERMQQPLAYEGHDSRVGVSIGIATDMDSLADPLRLLVNADIALYRAKDRGRNRHQFFNDALQAEIITTKRVADNILTGLEENQFTAHYQPQFHAETLEVIGVEALARWNHPTDGLLAPNAFLKIAEELNVVATIDRLILERALLDFHQWESVGLNVPKVSVNVSARRLHDDELIKSLRQMNIRPGAVAFELVESIFLDENDELITWNVDQIKELGIDIEIDDFGTGYASIVSLMKLKPRRLKIDRQLVMPIVHSPGQRQLVGSIIDIGRSLGIEVLAEGVETMEHARVLRQLGCNALQGYAFAKPMSAGDLVEFIRSRRWRDAG